MACADVELMPIDRVNHSDVILDCEKALEVQFRNIHDVMVWSGMSDPEAAQWLLTADDEPPIVALVKEAVDAGWPADIVRRAMLRLAKRNMERVSNQLSS